MEHIADGTHLLVERLFWPSSWRRISVAEWPLLPKAAVQQLGIIFSQWLFLARCW